VTEIRRRGSKIENKGWLGRHFRVLPITNDDLSERLEIKLLLWALLADFCKGDPSLLESLELSWGGDQPTLDPEDALNTLLKNQK
jgi:hypothetical protein